MTHKKLQTLDGFNDAAREAHDRANDPSPRPNGIACPKCGAELYDTTMMVLTSNPPQKTVGCKECGYHGYRIA
jgi:hypothetical protein